MPKSLHDMVTAALQTVPEVSPEQALDMSESGEWRLIDVREQDEFEAGHLPGAAHIPRGFIEVRADLEHFKRDPSMADRNQKLILYCGGGHRSALAGKALQEMGFSDVVSLAGGWRGWVERGMPTE